MPSIDCLTPTRISRQALTRVVAACAVAMGMCLALGVLAADKPGVEPAAQSEPMKLDEPMAGQMKKKGMMKGDMKKAAEKKDREMRPMIEKEERSMPQSPAKK